MFQSVFIIFQAIRGNEKISDSPGAKKQIWTALISTIAGIGVTIFTVNISLNSYAVIAKSWWSGFAISLVIGLFMFIIQKVLSDFSMEKWRYGISRVTPEIAFVSLIAVLAVGFVDYIHNMDGTVNYSYEASGLKDMNEVVTSDLTDPIEERYRRLIEKEEKVVSDILEIYTWKGNTYFAPTKYHPKEEFDGHNAQKLAAEARIDTLKNLRDGEIALALETYQGKLDFANGQNDSFKFTLGWVVRGCYLIMFVFSCLSSMSFLMLEEALYGKIEVSPDGLSRYVTPNWNPHPTVENSPNPVMGNYPGNPPGNPSGNPGNIQGKMDNNSSGNYTGNSHMGYRQGHHGKNEPETGKNWANSPAKDGNSQPGITNNFYEDLPPNNTGKNYQVTRAQRKKIQHLVKVHKNLSSSGNYPTQTELINATGWSRKTVKKYLEMTDLPIRKSR